jgi:hypothetical protein
LSSNATNSLFDAAAFPWEGRIFVPILPDLLV